MSPTRPTIPATRFAERLAAARALAGDAGLSAILVGVGADMRYLAGYAAMPLERLTMLVIPAAGDPSLVVPRLEAAPARLAPPAAAGLLPVVTWDEGDDAHALVVASLLRGARVGRQRAGCGSRSRTTCRLATCCRIRERLGEPTDRARVGHPARRSGWSRTPTRSRC